MIDCNIKIWSALFIFVGACGNIFLRHKLNTGGSYTGAVAACMSNGTVTNCYVTNTTVSGSGTVGTLVGYLGYSQVVNCYADTVTLVGDSTYGTIENSYCLSDETMAAKFLSGEIAYLLGEAYGQTCGEGTPVFGGAKVYAVTNCKNETAYSNTNAAIGHTWENGKCSVCEQDCGHSYDENGKCEHCGANQLTITQQPESSQQEIGQRFAITVEAQGDGLTYQWYYKESYMKDFKVFSNKSSAYAYSMQRYMNGRTVYCVITDQYGKQVQTEPVTIHLT